MNKTYKEVESNKEAINNSYEKFLKVHKLATTNFSLKDYETKIYNDTFLSAAKKALIYTQVESLEDR
jgi:hypothetical protein